MQTTQQTPTDLLQIKIEVARGKLPEETRQAIDAVPWRDAIVGLRKSRGYNFEQLGDLELETELLLCGLLSSEDYPKELEKRMRIPKAKVNELLNEMGQLVFDKIREKFIKRTERKKVFEKRSDSPVSSVQSAAPQTLKNDIDMLKSHGIEILSASGLPTVPKTQPMQTEKLELPTTKTEIHSVLAQKLSGSFQVPTTKTEYSLENIRKLPEIQRKSSLPANIITNIKPASSAETKVSPYYSLGGDPYRLDPEK